MDNGFLYVATGEKYLKEAELSVSSLKKVMPNAHVTLVTDNAYSSNSFDEILIQGFESIDETSWKANLVYKIMGIKSSPYTKTIFIDTDTYIVEPFDEMFGMLDFFDILICHDYYDKSQTTVQNGVLEGYYPYNTGVLAYSDKTSKLIADWLKAYTSNIEEYWSDQPAFMKAILINQVKIHVLSSVYNFRFLNNVAFPNNEKVKIIHGRASEKDFLRIAKTVNHDISQRVWVAVRKKCYFWSEKNWFLRLTKQAKGKAAKFLKTV